jgi:transposase InsO family protein
VNALKTSFAGKYSIHKICSTLDVARSSYYYRPVEFIEDEVIIKAVEDSFTDSFQTYGTLRIREDLKDLGHNVSRLRIGRIMASKNLVSCYTVKKKPRAKTTVNDSDQIDLVEGKFNNRKEHEVIVTDTTYIDISGQWHYLCSMLDLSRRSIVGSHVSKKRDSSLAINSMYDIGFDLGKIEILHSDRGSEFNSKAMSELLKCFDIKRSLSRKGTPTDNAVIESFFKTVKIEFVKRHKFTSIESFTKAWNQYVHWYNYKRRHSSLGYRPPLG